MNSFYISSNEITKKILKRTIEILSDVKESRVRNILKQRAKSSSFIKGILAYYLHEGLGGDFSDPERIDLSSKLEIFSSYGVILDNAIDEHEERNEKTTYLKEYGRNIHLFASQYALSFGLKTLMPYLGTSCAGFFEKLRLDKILLGMIKMDLGQSKSLDDHLEMLGSVNGLFNETILTMAARIATKDDKKVSSIGNYGFNLGMGLGIYEELRDLLGKHGRRRATEIERGRVITAMHMTKGFDYLEYVGRRLREEEYKTLLGELQKRDALFLTRDIIERYFEEALINLESAVDNKCVVKIKPLQDSIKSSMDFMLIRQY